MKSHSSAQIAINGTQKNIIEGLLNDYIEDILELDQPDAIKALRAAVSDSISEKDKHISYPFYAHDIELSFPF